MMLHKNHFSFQGQVQIEFMDGTLEDGRYKENKFVGIQRFFDVQKNFLNATLSRNGTIFVTFLLIELLVIFHLEKFCFHFFTVSFFNG
jgi:hypothetical protein